MCSYINYAQFCILLKTLLRTRFFVKPTLSELPERSSYFTFKPEIINKLRSPYAGEITGIANASGIPQGEILLFNIFYEVFTVCTSLVAQDKQGMWIVGAS